MISLNVFTDNYLRTQHDIMQQYVHLIQKLTCCYLLGLNNYTSPWIKSKARTCVKSYFKAEIFNLDMYTVGARIPNKFGIQMVHSGSVFEWFGFRMVRSNTKVYKNGPFENQTFQNGRFSLGCFRSTHFLS